MTKVEKNTELKNDDKNNIIKNIYEKKQKQKSNDLSIFLIKEEIKDHNHIILNHEKYYLLNEETNEGEEVEEYDEEHVSNITHFKQEFPMGTLYFQKSTHFPPPWINGFFKEENKMSEYLMNSSSKAIFLVKCNVKNGDIEKTERIFALSFSHGKSILDEYSVENIFGIKTALNMSDHNKIKKISKTAVGKDHKITNEQMPKNSNFIDFGFENYVDILKEVVVKSSVEKLEGFVEKDFTITGSNSLRLKAMVDTNNAKEFLSKIYEYYISDDYKKEFEFIDHVKFIKNKQKNSELDEIAFEKILSDDNNFIMAPPYIIDWNDFSGFENPDGKLSDDIDIQVYIDELIKMKKNKKMDDEEKDIQQTINFFKNTKITIKKTRGESHEKLSAYKCLIGEIDLKGNSYCINDGDWYELDKDYVKRVNNEYSKSEVSEIKFLDLEEGQKEADYNKKLSENLQEESIVLDAKIITNDNKKLEICDILTMDKMIHVKLHRTSRELSHLFFQGLNSTTLFKHKNKFYLEQGNKIIEEVTKENGLKYEDFELSSDKKMEIIYALPGLENEKRPHLPFFSRLSFMKINDAYRNIDVVFKMASIKRFKKSKKIVSK